MWREGDRSAVNRLGFKIAADLPRVFRYESVTASAASAGGAVFGREQEEAGMQSIRRIRSFPRRPLEHFVIRSVYPAASDFC